MLEWHRSLKDSDVRFFERHGDDERRFPHGNPLDEAPVLHPRARPAWDAYMWLLTWADGMGGVRLDALERYFVRPNPGSRLEPQSRASAQGLVPHLIREDRRLASEQRERDRQTAGRSKARRS